MGPGGTAQDITHNDGGVMYLIILWTINYYYYYYFCYNYYYSSCKTWPTLKETIKHTPMYGGPCMGTLHRIGVRGREDVSTNVTL